MAANSLIEIILRLRGLQEVAAGMTKAAAATNMLGVAAQRVGRNMDAASKRTWLENQALFTLRRYSYMATLAISAGIGVIAHWGYQYNSQIQQAKIALRLFLPSQQAVNNEITYLYNKTALTPFLFQDITLAARRFMAFGFTLQQTNDTITALTDSLSAMGLTTGAALNRASLALGHMMSLGRVTGQIVFQLARDNVPMVQALEHELGLTGDQLRNVGKLGISASTALGALDRYIEGGRMRGAAQRFALGSMHGILTTLRDYTARYIGEIEYKQFTGLQSRALRLVNFMRGAGARGYAQNGLTGLIGAWNPMMGRVFGLFVYDLHLAANILTHEVLPGLLLGVKLAGGPVYAVFYALSHVLGILNHLGFITKFLFVAIGIELTILAARWLLAAAAALVYNTALFAVAAAMRIGLILGIAQLVITGKNAEGQAIYDIVLSAGTKRMFAWTLALIKNQVILRAVNLWTRLTTAATKLYQLATVRAGRAIFLFGFYSKIAVFALKQVWWEIRATAAAIYTKLIPALVRERIAAALAWIASLGPIAWITAGIVAIVAILVVLYFKWKWFHNLVNNTWRWIKDHWPLLAGIIGGPFFLAFGALYKYFDQIKTKILAVYNWIVDKVRWINREIHKVFGWIPGLGGGTSTTVVTAGQMTPWGTPIATSSPQFAPRNIPASNTLDTGKMTPWGTPIQVHVRNENTLLLDGKQVAKTVSKARQDQLARK